MGDSSDTHGRLAGDNIWTPGNAANKPSKPRNQIDPREDSLLPVGPLHTSALNMKSLITPDVGDPELVARAKAGELDAFEA